MNQTCIMNKFAILAMLFMATASSGWSQCTADFDFGDLTLGVSPDPEAGESFAPGLVGEPYEDVLHLLLPVNVLDIDSTLPFSPTTPLDSVALATITLVDLADTLQTYSLEELGLSVTCNNNGDSGNPCTFLGGNQYCAAITGVPNAMGSYRVDISVTGYVTVFGFPFGQEQAYGSFVLDVGIEGCTNPEAVNYDPTAVIDDGSCVLDNCFGDVNGDNTVSVGDLLEILAEFGCTSGCTVDISGDGLVTVTDLLELLGVYGASCG